MSKEILKDRNGYYDSEMADIPPELVSRAAGELVQVFDEVLLPSLPEIEKVVAGKMMPFEHRSRYISYNFV